MISSVAALYLEELKATIRGRFAWLGGAAVLLGVGGLATVGTQDTWLDGYGIVAYGLVPLGFIPVAALMIASPRANRFVESVFTAPVERGEWLAAKVLVLLTLAAAYYFALFPMMLVYSAHVGVPPLLNQFLLWTPGLLLISVAVGALIGVLFIGRSLAAPAGAGMGVLLAYAGLIALQELLVAQGNGATRSGHVTLASPAVLLKNALGFTLVTANIPATTLMSWISIGLVVFGSLALAVWIFLNAQGVETWEASRAQRWFITLAILTLVAFPIAFGDTNYDVAAPRNTNAPAIRGLFARAGNNMALVDSGRPPPSRCCGTILNRDDWPLSTDEKARRDLLLFLPIEADKPLTDLTVKVTGENGLIALAGAPALEARAYQDDSGPAAEDGHHIKSGWMLRRVPVTLDPTHPWDIGGDRYPLNASANWRVVGESKANSFIGRAAIDAQVGPANFQMGLAALLLPLLCAGAALLRWRRTR